jgi:uncharacterized protein YjiS (DUF1127 family)
VVYSCARPVGDRGDLHKLGSSSRCENRGKNPSSAISLWEPLMLNSLKSANTIARRYDVQSRERRKSLAVVASSTSPKVRGAELEEDTNRPGPTRPWGTVRSRWAQWRRERKIKKVVAVLVELDDRTLRDIGVPHRSQIEQVVRYCFDC